MTIRRATLIAVALVVLRSFVWVWWEQAHFDSDQAIHGLMALHIADGEAWPVFMYGQSYLLAIEAWLAAPLLAISGASVLWLKLPLVVVNVAIAALLLRLLVREVGLSPLHALAASLPFVAAAPVAASRLVEAAGANVEPFLWILLVWIVRDRPVWLGAVAGIGLLNREFTAYALVALVWIAWREGALCHRAAWLRLGTSMATLIAVWFGGTLLAAQADVLGPGTAGLGTEGLMSGGSSRVCFSPAELPENLTWLVSRNLSVVFGFRPEPLAFYNLTSQLSSGNPWLLWLLGLFAGLLVAVRFGTAHRARSFRGDSVQAGTAPSSGFPVFLMLVGVQAALAYALASCAVRDGMLVRYTLLTIFGGVGLAAWLFRAAPSGRVRAAALAMLVTWGAASLWDSGRVLAEYLHQEPPNKVRRLMTYLEAERVRFGWAPYWTAYVVDFLSNEHITLASSDVVRIAAYQQAVEAAAGDRVMITNQPCGDPRLVVLEHWCIERLDRTSIGR